MSRVMGSFGRNVYNGGNVHNVPVYAANHYLANVYLGTTPRNEGGGMLTFANYLGKKRSV